MPDNPTPQCCGTCKHFSPMPPTFFTSPCLYPVPDWVEARHDVSGEEMMSPHEGTTCPCWVKKVTDTQVLTVTLARVVEDK